MRWPTTRKPSTVELVRAEHRLQANRKGRHWPLLVLLAMLALLWQHLQRQDERAGFEQRLAVASESNRSLQQTLEQSHLQLREAQAAQEQLLRRIEEMSAQAKRLKTELAFFRQQKKNGR